MKIAIITKVDNNNYGNRLQNYACQQIFKRITPYVDTINNVAQLNNGTDNKLINLLKRVKYTMIPALRIVVNKRYRRFIQFNKKIHITRKIYDDKHLPKANQYDYVFIGSDQVWNPNFDVPELYFATFCDKSKRNSFSASFGINSINEDVKGWYCDKINELNHISVREEQGKKIIKDLTGREDVEVLVDPTMLLNDEEWTKLALKPKKFKSSKYILTYFLGELSENRRKEINRIAKENNCDIIDIISNKSEFYDIGPSEFLYLEKNAFLICTDSFHSSIFAILFNNPLVVFDREDSNQKMNSRLETLLKTFKLENRWFDKKIKENQLTANYEQAYEILEVERKKSLDFINNSMTN